MIEKSFTSAADHVADGYDKGKAEEGAWAFSSLPPPDGNAAIAFNATMSATQSALPPLTQLQIESIGAGHGNAFLRAVKAGSPCAIESLAPSGKLDPYSLCEHHPGLREALQRGLRWKVIHGLVAKRWPQLVDLAQAVLNRRHSLDMSEIEGMLTIHTRAESFQAEGTPINWFECGADAAASNPTWKDWSQSLVRVCQLVDKDTIKELSLKYGAKLAATTGCNADVNGPTVTYGMLGPTFLDRIAAMKWKSRVQQFPKIRAACMLAALCAPPLKVETGRCALISPTNISRLSKNDSETVGMIKTAESYIDAAGEWLQHNQNRTGGRLLEDGKPRVQARLLYDGHRGGQR
jgi:hypothetical protein